jgi:hypothetical protein
MGDEEEVVYDVGGRLLTDRDLPWNRPGMLPEYGKEALLFNRGVDRTTSAPIMGMPKNPNWMASYIKDPDLRKHELTRGRDEWNAYWKHVESKKNDPKLGAAARQLLFVKQNRAKAMIGFEKEMQRKAPGYKTPADWRGPLQKDAFQSYIVGQNSVPLEDNAFAAYKSRFG